MRRKIGKFVLIDLAFVYLGLLKLYGLGETGGDRYIITSILILLGFPLFLMVGYFIVKVLNYLISLIKKMNTCSRSRFFRANCIY